MKKEKLRRKKEKKVWIGLQQPKQSDSISTAKAAEGEEEEKKDGEGFYI